MTKRVVYVIPVISLLISLVACTDSVSKEDDTAYISAEYLDFDATLVADYGELTYNYKFHYFVDSDGIGEITVIEPQVLSGLTAEIAADGVSLKFSDVTLDTGNIRDSNLTPVNVVPSIVEAWKSAFITSSWKETIDSTDSIAVSMDIAHGSDDESVIQTTWFEEESFMPILTEIYINGAMAVQCKFENIDIG